jgi:trehalose synthase
VDEAAEKIVRLVKNPGLRQQLGQNARETVKGNFLLTRYLEQFLDLFNSYDTVFKLTDTVDKYK